MLLAQREHSRAELRRKLMPMARADVLAKAGEHADPSVCAEAAAAHVDTLLDWLTTHKYLSEERFVESRVQARASRFGNRRIEQELSQHGVSLDANTRTTLRDTELSRAKAVWTRKYGHPPADSAERMRQMRFLTARGFSTDAVRQVVPKAKAPSRDDTD
jgi:regulatory protein